MQKSGFVAENDHGYTVVLDTNLTPELIEEGLAREVISKLQTMRKDADFEVTDRIEVGVVSTDKVNAAVEKSSDAIMKGVLAVSIAMNALDGVEGKEWNINGEKATLYIKKA